MKKDFTYNTYQQILKYISEMEQSSLGSGMSRFFGSIYAAIYAAKAKAAGISGKAAIEDYYRKILDYMHYQSIHINKIFSKANALDAKYAQKFGWVYDQGERLLQEIQALTKIATPKKYADVRQMPELKLKIIDGISDKALIEYCAKSNGAGNVYEQSLSNTSDALYDIDGLTLFLIALFHHKDIVYDNFLTNYGVYGVNFAAYVKEQIISGTQGFTTLEEIAAQLRVTEDYVLYLLGDKEGRNLKERYKTLEEWEKWEKSNRYTFHDEQVLIGKLNKILEQNAKYLTNNEDKLRAYLETIGVDYDVYIASQSTEVNGYMVSSYQKMLAKTLETLCDRENLNVYPEKMKWAISVVNDIHTLGTLGKRGEYLKKAWKDDKLSDSECAEFLLEYLHIDEVDLNDIAMFRFVETTMKKIGYFDKAMSAVQGGIDRLAYLMADYQAELDVLESLKRSGHNDATYILALAEIETIYKNKFQTFAGEMIRGSIEKGTDKLLSKAFPGLSEAEALIGIAGKYTGATKHTSAAQDVMTLYNMCFDATNIYENTVNNVAINASIGKLDDEMLQDVRNSFEYMKQVYTQYYETQIEYYDGYAFSLGADKDKQDYLKSELSKIQNLKLGDTYTPETYEAYRLRVS